MDNFLAHNVDNTRVLAKHVLGLHMDWMDCIGYTVYLLESGTAAINVFLIINVFILITLHASSFIYNWCTQFCVLYHPPFDRIFLHIFQENFIIFKF